MKARKPGRSVIARLQVRIQDLTEALREATHRMTLLENEIGVLQEALLRGELRTRTETPSDIATEALGV